MTTDWPLSRQQAQALQEREAERVKVPTFSRLDLGDSLFIDLVFIPGGTFPMGSTSQEGNPPRMVRISKGFLISKYEVTWRQFLRVVDRADVDFMSRRWTDQQFAEWTDLANARGAWEHPARVMWLLAEKFCSKLSKVQGISARLPTEAEWEYACRAGTTGLYGESDSIDETKANVSKWPGPDGRSVFTKKARPWFVPVGQYAPNQWGVHDMMGNADEWCLDAYSDRTDIRKLPAVDPVARGGASALFRVVRGGSLTGAETVFYRTGDATSGDDRGIRIVIEIDDAVRARLVKGE